MRKYKVGIGQDSHRFLSNEIEKKCIIAGLEFEAPGFDADSDGDVIYHAICNAISSVTHVPMLGGVAIKLCHEDKITDSRVYLKRALETLKGFSIDHIALTLEGKRPKFQKRALEIRTSVSEAVGVEIEDVGVTFTSGDGLTAFGRGEGVMCYAVVTFSCAG